MKRDSRAIAGTATLNEDTLVLSIDGKSIQLSWDEANNLLGGGTEYRVGSARHTGKADPDGDGVFQVCNASNDVPLYSVLSGTYWSDSVTPTEIGFSGVANIYNKTFRELNDCTAPGSTSARLVFGNDGSGTYYERNSNTPEAFGSGDVEAILSTTGVEDGGYKTWWRIFRLNLGGTERYFILESSNNPDNDPVIWVEAAMLAS